MKDVTKEKKTETYTKTRVIFCFWMTCTYVGGIHLYCQRNIKQFKVDTPFQHGVCYNGVHCMKVNYILFLNYMKQHFEFKKRFLLSYINIRL